MAGGGGQGHRWPLGHIASRIEPTTMQRTPPFSPAGVTVTRVRVGGTVPDEPAQAVSQLLQGADRPGGGIPASRVPLREAGYAPSAAPDRWRTRCS